MSNNLELFHVEGEILGCEIHAVYSSEDEARARVSNLMVMGNSFMMGAFPKDYTEGKCRFVFSENIRRENCILEMIDLYDEGDICVQIVVQYIDLDDEPHWKPASGFALGTKVTEKQLFPQNHGQTT